MSLLYNLNKVFNERYGKPSFVVRSPGRVNLIGEHTDYNMGLVLPAAINKNIWLAISERNDDEIHLFSVDYNQSHTSNIHSLERSELLWPDYLLGIVDQLKARGYPVKGFNAAFTGDIPLGGGMSSSAALECATTLGLSKINNLGLEKMDIALISQAAENEFVGVKCGLMDQFASAFGKRQFLIKLDCRDNTFEYIPFHTDELRIVLFDTQVKHSLASSAYNERREQCEDGVRLLAQHDSEINSLRDATEEMLLKYVKPEDEIVYNRCSFIVAEIARLKAGIKDLEKDDFISFGKRMFETHDGLQLLYQVSCPELDILVDLVRNEKNVLGARMMGGGFGGCTINIVPTHAVEGIVSRVSAAYFEFIGHEPKVYIVEIEDGTALIV